MLNITRKGITSRWRLAVLGAALASAMLVIAACGGGNDGAAQVPAGSLGSGSLTQGQGDLALAAERSGSVLASTGIQYSTNQQAGIWVTASGEVDAIPDLVILSAGIQARAKTVDEARGQAAAAMDRVMAVLRDHNIDDADVQTRQFTISPEYVWNESRRQQELTGFMVNNNLSVRIRDVDGVGLIIDDVAEAGGDLTRINGISFTVEDTTALEFQARERAIEAMMAEARQIAELTEVTLGRPFFLTETGGAIPQTMAFAERSLAADGAQGVATSISLGELTVRVTMQGVFAIE